MAHMVYDHQKCLSNYPQRSAIIFDYSYLIMFAIRKKNALITRWSLVQVHPPQPSQKKPSNRVASSDFGPMSDGLEAVAAVVSRRQKRPSSGVFNDGLCEKDRLRRMECEQTCLI
jgi:hypothetical protein